MWTVSKFFNSFEILDILEIFDSLEILDILDILEILEKFEIQDSVGSLELWPVSRFRTFSTVSSF